MSVVEYTNENTIRLIEKLCKTETLLALLSFILYFDSVLRINFNKNLITFDWTMFDIANNISFILVNIVIYSVLASIVIPCFNFWIIYFLRMKRKSFEGNTDIKHTVRYYEVRKYADFTNNPILDKWCDNIDKHEIELNQISKYSFSVMFFICINLFLGISNGEPLLKYIVLSYDAFYNFVYKSMNDGVWGIFVAKSVVNCLYVLFYCIGVFFYALWDKSSFFDKYDTCLVNEELAKLINKDKIEAQEKKWERSLRTLPL